MNTCVRKTVTLTLYTEQVIHLCFKGIQQLLHQLVCNHFNSHCKIEYTCSHTHTNMYMYIHVYMRIMNINIPLPPNKLYDIIGAKSPLASIYFKNFLRDTCIFLCLFFPTAHYRLVKTFRIKLSAPLFPPMIS